MTQWAPEWKVTIQGIEYTDVVLANLSITSGRTNIYEQAQAGYCSVNLIIFGQAALPYEINDTISILAQLLPKSMTQYQFKSKTRPELTWQSLADLSWTSP